MEFFTGFEDNIPLCCVLFYESVWLPSMRMKIPEYTEKMWELSNHTGILLCPECLVKIFTNGIMTSQVNGEYVKVFP